MGRSRPGFGAGSHLRALEAMGAGVPASMGLLGAPRPTRCARRKAKIQRARAEVHTAFAQHVITQRLAPMSWRIGARGPRSRSQRFSASSAVEGRNGALAQLHHNQRVTEAAVQGVDRPVIFDCRAPDGTTPAARFFRRTFPDLFETVLARIDALPQPRRRKRQIALSH